MRLLRLAGIAGCGNGLTAGRVFVMTPLDAGRIRPSWTFVARKAHLGVAGLLAVLAVVGCSPVAATGSPTGAATPTPSSQAQTPTISPIGLLATATPTAGATPTPSSQASSAASAITSTGSMTTARFAHSATRLADGRVLIVGGGTGATDAISFGAFASAEIYNPVSGTFKATGSMRTPRGDHTATLLSDGRVLITGGSNDSMSAGLAQAEIYDPASGEFTATRTMGTVRSGAMAVLLLDGRVLIAGGYKAQTPPYPIGSAELYDPTTGKFSPTGSMTTARDGATATRLADGRVLIAGGVDSSFATLASAELYDPATGKFSPTGSMTTARDGATATRLADGRVLIAGGHDIASAELYDPQTGKFSGTGSMRSATWSQAAFPLSDGRVLVWGDSTSTTTSSQPRCTTPTPAPSPRQHRCGPALDLATLRRCYPMAGS